MVFCLEDGTPIDTHLCQKWFEKWQEKNVALELPKIVMHGLRHSSTTYKLMISGGDIKSVQGDTGHSTASMVVDTYSHIQDESRSKLTNLFEKTFTVELLRKKI